MRSWKEGDTLEVVHVSITRDDEGKVCLLDGGESPFPVRIVSVRTYVSFEEALKDLWRGGEAPLDEVLPGVSSIAEGVGVYRRFVSLETQARDGVCMLELAPVSD